MSDMNKLDELRPIANEMLGGLHAGEEMRHRVLRAAREERAVKKNTMKRAVPAVCMAALALVCVGAAGLRINHPDDAAVTQSIEAVLRHLGIRLIDHIIVAGGETYSMSLNGKLSCTGVRTQVDGRRCREDEQDYVWLDERTLD